MSDSVQPQSWQPTRLPHPWDSPGKNAGVGCHFLLQCMKLKSESEVAQSCPTLSDPMDCSLTGSSVHGIFQARVLEWGAIAFSVKEQRGLIINQSFANCYREKKIRNMFFLLLVLSRLQYKLQVSFTQKDSEMEIYIQKFYYKHSQN